MTIVSLAVFAWLAVTACLAWLLPRKWQPLAITLSTALFLIWYSALSFLILASNSLFVYLLSRKGIKKPALIIALSGYIVAVFVWFKIRDAPGAFLTAEDYIMPLGLSYYSFRQIHYLFEGWKGKLEQHGLMEYLCYMFFLPTIHVGPIHRFPGFLRDLRRRRWEYRNFSMGLERILYGYAKIVILGNNLIPMKFGAIIAEYGASPVLLHDYLESVLSWLSLYCQFSGYCDIAIGFSLIMGFNIIENFDNPFLSPNIGEFWKRWHISLTSWCREYVYMPLAALTRKSFFALLATMVLIGLWHELSIRYVLWGVYHSLGIAVWHSFQPLKKRLPVLDKSRWKYPVHVVSVFLTVNFVFASFTVTNFVYERIRVMF